MHRFGHRLLVKSSKGIRVLIRYVERVPYVFLFFFSDVILSQKGERHEEQSLFKGVTSPIGNLFLLFGNFESGMFLPFMAISNFEFNNCI